jgi:hypothetical protein
LEWFWNMIDEVQSLVSGWLLHGSFGLSSVKMSMLDPQSIHITQTEQQHKSRNEEPKHGKPHRHISEEWGNLISCIEFLFVADMIGSHF